MNRLLPRTLLIPAVAVLLCWMLAPLLMTIYFSLVDYNLTRPGEHPFVGFSNYHHFITNPDFLAALWQTLLFLVSVVGTTVIGGIELHNKTAAITGAASGIGLATSESLIANGARVVCIDRDEKALAALHKTHGEAVIPLVLDLLDREQCRSRVDQILARVNHLDIFHANAEIYIGGDLIDADFDQIDRMLELNINVVMKNIRSIIPHMIERSTGDIIVTSSLAAHTAVSRGSRSISPPNGR